MKIDMGEILKNKRIESAYSVKEVSDALVAKGFKASNSTIYSWENNNSQPTPDAMFFLCNMYGIDNVLKTFGYDGKDENGNIAPTLNELGLIEKYRDLDNHGKEMIDVVLTKEHERWEEEQYQKKLNNNKIVDMPKNEHKSVNAAHARTDIEITDEMKQHDDDIMDDKNF